MVKRRAPSKRNPVASSLANPMFRPRVVKSKRVYSRKNRKEETA